MTQKILIADSSWTPEQAQDVAARNDCCAYVSGIPIGSAGLAAAHGWTVPCIIVEDIETLETVSWSSLPLTP